MHYCTVQLLRSSDEESIECLCHLLTIVGKKMEQKTKHNAQLDPYFARLSAIANNKATDIKVSTRIRFMIMDLLDLRKVSSVHVHPW